MKKFILLILCVALLPIVSRGNDTKKAIKANLVQQFKMGNFQEGRKFIVAIPPNESPSYHWSDSAMEIYISSASDTYLKLYGLVTTKTILVKAGEVYVVSENEGLMKTSAECREPNTATNKTITIEASSPVSVYVMNSKSTTSDGYMAIPVDNWDTEYLHCSYYDNYESKINTFAGGFLVLGSEDNTQVNVTLRGIGDASIATLRDSDKSIGDHVSFSVGEGEVYQISADGLTRGQFDLSGSLITADKPIGVISYHQRTVIPIFTSSSRDHLSAMMPPINTLSKRYASIALDRNNSHKGDMFRIVAVEDNTTYSAKWFDFNTQQQLGSKTGTISQAGEFVEISEMLKASALDSSITGTSIFEADKPILLMQYSYSGGWDESLYDPFMWIVTAEDQYVTHAIVQAPSNKTFGENYINIIAKDLSGDPSLPNLKTLTIDDVKIIDLVPSFTSNNIPGTDLYWARFAISQGSHKLKGNGNAVFGAYIYGYKSVDSYGWPAAMGTKAMDEIDTTCPNISYDNISPNPIIWEIHVKEKQDDSELVEKGTVHQKDSKVWFEPLTLIKDEYGLTSTNFKDPYTDFTWEFEGHDDYIVKLEVEDEYQFAEANFYVADYTGNIALGNIKYYPNLLTLTNEESVDFGTVELNTKKSNVLTFENAGDVDFTLHSINLSNNETFHIKTEELPTSIAQNQSIEIAIDYLPTSATDKDMDTLTITTDNITHKWILSGNTIKSEESLELASSTELDYGTVYTNETATHNFVLNNTGEINCEIESISLRDGSLFNFSNDIHTPIVILPGESFNFDIVYAPLVKSDADNDSLVVQTNKYFYAWRLSGKAEVDVSVNDKVLDNDLINVNPNPITTNGSITLTLPKSAHCTASLYSSNGTLVKTVFDGLGRKGENTIELQTTNVASGTYTLIVEMGDLRQSTQVIISK